MCLLLPHHPCGVSRDALRSYLLEQAKQKRFISLNQRDYILSRNIFLSEFLPAWSQRWAYRWETLPLLLPYRLTKPRLVSMSDLYPTDDSLEIEGLLEILSGSELANASARYTTRESSYGLPWCVKLGKKYYVMDGHHRLWMTAALGQRAVWIRVLHGNYYFHRYPLDTGKENQEDDHKTFDLSPTGVPEPAQPNPA